MFLEFDAAKDAVNQGKHGLSLAIAEHFDWEHEPVQPAKAVGGEARWKILATADDQLVAAIFTMRGAVARIISVRRASRQERTHYEQKVRRARSGEPGVDGG